MLLTTQPQDLVLDLEWRPVQVMMRGAGTIRDPGFATLSVSVQQPVSTLTRNPHRFRRMNHSSSLNSDTVDQQQPVMNSQTDLRAGHEDLRLIGVNAFNAPLRGPPFINARCHPHPGRVHLAADRRRFWPVGGHRDGRRRLRRAGQTGRGRLAAGPGLSPPRRPPHDAATTPVARRSRTETRIGRCLRRIEATGGNAVTTGRGPGENSRSSRELRRWNCNIVTACYSSLQFR